MTDIDALVEDQVVADPILAREETDDADGDVGICRPDNPSRLLITCFRAQERVGCDVIGGLGSPVLRAGGIPATGVAVQRGDPSATHRRVLRVDSPEPCR